MSIFFKFYTDCVYGWAKLIKPELKPSVELIPSIFSDSVMTFTLQWNLCYINFIFPRIIFLWIFIEAATSSVPDFEHLNNIRNLFFSPALWIWSFMHLFLKNKHLNTKPYWLIEMTLTVSIRSRQLKSWALCLRGQG